MTPATSTNTIPADLYNLLQNGDFILFLGAGTSVEAGLPDWKNSLLELSRNLAPLHAPYASLIADETANDRFLNAAELFYMAPVTPSQRSDLLRTVFAKDLSITRRLKLLSQTRCQGIVTTNFDRSLQQAATEAHSQLVHFGESDTDLAAARVESNRFLLRLHGRIEVPESLIFALTRVVSDFYDCGATVVSSHAVELAR